MPDRLARRPSDLQRTYMLEHELAQRDAELRDANREFGSLQQLLNQVCYCAHD